MRITKFGHACVRIEHDGHALVLDPGIFTEPEAVDGATAVLITHEHADHFHPDNLRATDAPIFTIEAVAAKLRDVAPDVAERVTVVGPAGAGSIPGLRVTTVGELHAIIHPEFDRITNSGYLISVGGTTVYHPGDALTVPDAVVDVLLVPSSAPWLRSQDAIEFARAVQAPRNLAIHDRIYSEAGHGFLEMQMNAFLPAAGQEYLRRADGHDL